MCFSINRHWDLRSSNKRRIGVLNVDYYKAFKVYLVERLDEGCFYIQLRELWREGIIQFKECLPRHPNFGCVQSDRKNRFWTKAEIKAGEIYLGCHAFVGLPRPKHTHGRIFTRMFTKDVFDEIATTSSCRDNENLVPEAIVCNEHSPVYKGGRKPKIRYAYGFVLVKVFPYSFEDVVAIDDREAVFCKYLIRLSTIDWAFERVLEVFKSKTKSTWESEPHLEFGSELYDKASEIIGDFVEA